VYSTISPKHEGSGRYWHTGAVGSPTERMRGRSSHWCSCYGSVMVVPIPVVYQCPRCISARGIQVPGVYQCQGCTWAYLRVLAVGAEQDRE